MAYYEYGERETVLLICATKICTLSLEGTFYAQRGYIEWCFEIVEITIFCLVLIPKRKKINLTDDSAYPCKVRTALRGCKALNREGMHVQNSPMLIIHHEDTAEACYVGADNACGVLLW